MKVHHSTQNYFSTPIRSQQSSESDDSSTFSLLSDGGDQQKGSQGPSISSSGVPSSISSGFWLNQLSQASSSTTDAADDRSAASVSGSSSASSSRQSDQDILDEFAKWANMTPAQKIRAQYLEAHGLTEDSFKALSADEQKAINDQIASEIKQKLGVGNADGERDGDKETDSAASALSIA
ncbi:MULTISPECIES: hypothetical protein [unclassified Rhizobium]|uniref:hypothetical protein n=1 Tax=unclassified Rhizobium TaxID=2613769 RepID=UPI000DDDC787|nr:MULTISPECIES: hypothetical protein [unclassified Rhizobium]MBB3288044.1 hypothetical protein [Rhizobium sp. BK252]MBB3403093.1 hypothetical protein [Rhizobium sp. BK289]MBB3415670.1 hypothetical protein [Rhizobium sp. BK284]MBB3483250.1 hypothetical protein [Rhizobium sp. BK347]MDK4723886.1 hypothetical protein [Rhizobium sp. CNPSo 3968]